MIVFVQLTSAGVDVGPFDVYQWLAPNWVLVESGVSRTTLILGTNYTVDDGATIIRLQSSGACDNYLDLVIGTSTTTTTTTGEPTTTTTTTTLAGTTTTTTTTEDLGTTTTTTTTEDLGTTTTTTTTEDLGTTTTTTTTEDPGTTTTTTTTEASTTTTTTTTEAPSYYTYYVNNFGELCETVGVTPWYAANPIETVTAFYDNPALTGNKHNNGTATTIGWSYTPNVAADYHGDINDLGDIGSQTPCATPSTTTTTSTTEPPSMAWYTTDVGGVCTENPGSNVFYTADGADPLTITAFYLNTGLSILWEPGAPGTVAYNSTGAGNAVTHQANITANGVISGNSAC